MGRILIAEDHAIVSSGLKLIFEKEFRNDELVFVSDTVELMKFLKNNTYQLAVLDLQLRDGQTFNLIPDILALYPYLRILIFTGLREELYAKRLYNLGVKGYLSKNSDENEIISAIRTVYQGNIYLSEHFKFVLLGKTKEENTTQNPFDLLSQREMETALLLLQGKRSKDICMELNLHPSTVTSYKLNVFTKLGVANIIELEKIAKLYNVF